MPTTALCIILAVLQLTAHVKHVSGQVYDLQRLATDVFEKLDYVKQINNLSPDERDSFVATLNSLSLDHGVISADIKDSFFSNNKYVNSTITETCRNETEYLLTQLDALSKLKVFDSWGKIDSGLLEGNTKWYGGFDECLSITSASNGSLPTNFTTRYCSASIPLKKLGTLTLGTCVPKGCNADDVGVLMNSIYSHLSNQTITVVCKPDYAERTMSGGRQFALVFASIIAGVCILATLYELALQLIDRFKDKDAGKSLDESTPLISRSYSGKNESSDRQHGKLSKTILCFSLYSNSKKILDTTQPPGAINCINGIRFFSMSWVILGHFLGFVVAMNMKNMTFIAELLNRLSMQAIVNATVSVDSFFVMSGLLVAYLFLKDFTRRRMEVKGLLKALPMIYLQRYLRLTPAYGIMILYTTCIVWYIWNGPNWPYDPDNPTHGTMDPNCEKKWWMSLLYVNNLAPIKKECVAWGWYLANDFQFFLVAPFVVFLFYKSQIAGLVLSVLMTIGSTIAAFVVSYDQGTGITQLNQPKKQFDFEEYSVPWTRFQTYGIGMIAGLILFKLKQMNYRIPTVLNLCLWGVSAALLLSVLYGPYNAVRPSGGHTPSSTENVAYSGLSRASWGLGLSYIIIACSLGQGGWIDEFLSWKAFIPLSRLTYCAYLIHIPVLLVIAFGAREAEYFNEVIIARDFVPVLTTVMFLAFIFSLFYELPFVNLDKLYLSPLSIKKDRYQEGKTPTNRGNDSYVKINTKDHGPIY